MKGKGEKIHWNGKKNTLRENNKTKVNGSTKECK